VSRLMSAQFVIPAVTFLVSGALLTYELLVTRMASVLLTSQHLFLILSMALLGIAVGAIVEYKVQQWKRPTTSVGVPLGWTAIALVMSLLLTLRFGPDQGTFVLALAVALPFGCSGFLLARIFRLQPERSGLLYAADLLGAAAGALVFPGLIRTLGPVESIVLVAAILGSLAAIAHLAEQRGWSTAGMTLLAASLIGLTFLNRDDRVFGDVPVGRHPDKDLYRIAALMEGSVTTVESRWSTFGRTDLVRFGDDTSSMSVFVDGAAGTSMLQFDGDFSNPPPAFQHATTNFQGSLPLLVLREEQKDDALIIGPGGGRDVLLALMTGIKQITAVDINPQMIELVRDYGDFNGHIYTDYPHVRVIVDDGRRFLRHSNERYDVIILFMPITKSSRGLNAFALSENHLFTREALGDYHDHLQDDGTLLIMAHGMLEVTKLLSTSLAALEERGLPTGEAMSHVFLLGSRMMPLFGLQKSPISTEMAVAMHEVAHTSGFDCGLSYIPGVQQELVRAAPVELIETSSSMMSPLFIDLQKGQLPVETLRTGLGYDFAPPSDDRPYFFQYARSLPGVIPAVFGIAMAVLLFVFLLPARRVLGTRTTTLRWLCVFFVSIGLGYVVVELAMIQRIVFYLGDPSRSLAMLLAALLVGSGVGSFVSRRSTASAAVFGGALSAVVILLLQFTLPSTLSASHDRPWLQAVLGAASLFLLGIPMGVMFPVGLRSGEKKWGRGIVPWIWAVTGSASVAGGALAVGVAMQVGTSWSLAVGATLYVAAAVAAANMSRPQRVFAGRE